MKSRAAGVLATLVLLATVVGLARGGDQPGASGWSGIVYGNGPNGVTVNFVMHGSPADVAGIDTGVVIETIDEKPVPDAAGLHNYLGTAKEGQSLAFGVKDAAGGKRTITVVLGRRDPATLIKTSLRDGAKALASRAAPCGEGWARHQGPQTPDDLGSGVTALAVRALAQLPEDIRQPYVGLIDRSLATLRKRAETTYWVTDENSLAGQSYETHATAEALLALVARHGKGHADVAHLASGLAARQLGTRIGPYANWFTDLDWQTGGFPFEDRAIVRRSDIRVTVAAQCIALEALNAAGYDKEHPVMVSARRYLARVQNLDDEPEALLKDLVDGGFPESGMVSKAGPKDVGERRIHRSYGSATTDGLAALIYTGSEERRIKAARDWIRNHFELSRTPGFVPDPANPRMRNPFEQGIRFYYVQSLARTLDLVGEVPFQTSQGTRQWPVEILNTLLADQRRDGAWKNYVPVMDEDNEVIATASALLALEKVYRHIAPPK